MATTAVTPEQSQTMRGPSLTKDSNPDSLDKSGLLSSNEPLATEAPFQDYEGAFLKMFLTLIALVVGIFFTAWALKRLARGKLHQFNANRTIKIIERRALSPKTMLYLVEVRGKQAMIAESQLEVKHLLTLEDLNIPMDQSSSE